MNRDGNDENEPAERRCGGIAATKGALVVTQAPGGGWENREAAAAAFSTDFRAGCPALMGTRVESFGKWHHPQSYVSNFPMRPASS